MCFIRSGRRDQISRLPYSEGAEPAKSQFKNHPIDSFHNTVAPGIVQTDSKP